MNTYLLNRAFLNRNALDDDQRKAMFARLGGGSGGGGGWKGAAKRGWDKIKQGVSEMGRLPTPEESLNKLESDAQGRDALIRSALAFTPAGAGVAIDDMMHARKPSDLALASLGALPFVGGLGDDVARGMSAARTPLSKDALLGKFRDALRNIAGDASDMQRTADKRITGYLHGADEQGRAFRIPATQKQLDEAARADDLWAHSKVRGQPDEYSDVVQAARERVAARLRQERAAKVTETQARRNELAAALRRDRELKRLDQHPELFRTTQPFMSASERRLRSAAARNPSAPAAEFGYMGGGTIGERVARIEREAKAYHAAKATARGHRPGETLALYDNRRPMTEEQRRGMFAAKAGGPNVVRSITSTPGGSTIQRTTETGFRRPAPQTGAVGGPIPDQLRRPNPMEGIAPRQGRKGPEVPAAPHPGNPPPQGTIAYKQWLKDYGEWEKTLPGAGLRPWGSGGAFDQPGTGAARDRASNVKAKATSLLKKAAATRKNATQHAPAGALDDRGYTGPATRPTLNPASPLARFLALPTLRR